MSRSASRVFAHRPLFALAALYGAAVVPLWSLAYGGLLPGWAPPANWHGHEMLFGFALAVVGGYLITQATWRSVAIAAAAWLVGRAAGAAGDLPAGLSALAALAYPLCLFALAGLPLLRAAKRWRNLVFAPILGAFVVAELVFQAGAAGLVADGARRGLAMAIAVVALLLFVMGGRVIAAASSGALQRGGAPHRDMAQGRVEAAGVACLATLALASLFHLDRLGALAAGAAGLLALARLWRWRPWLLWRSPEIAFLGLGYGWLAGGLLLLAPASALGAPGWADAIHGIAIGALGTLAATMMLRVAQQRARQAITLSGIRVAAIALVNGAALARLAAIWWEAARLPLIEIAAGMWSIGLFVVALDVWRRRPR